MLGCYVRDKNQGEAENPGPSQGLMGWDPARLGRVGLRGQEGPHPGEGVGVGKTDVSG